MFSNPLCAAQFSDFLAAYLPTLVALLFNILLPAIMRSAFRLTDICCPLFTLVVVVQHSRRFEAMRQSPKSNNMCALHFACAAAINLLLL